MALSWLTAVILAICAVLLVTVLILAFRTMRGAKGEHHIRAQEFLGNTVDITVYAYDSGINGLDDIKALHIGIYRDTGVITDISDDCSIYRERFMQTNDNDRELGLIVRSAAEVKRVTDKTVLYYFRGIRPLKLKSGNIRGLYDCIINGLDGNKPVVLRMTKSAAGDSEL